MAIVHLPPPSSAEIRSLWGREKSSYGFGEAGMQLDRKLDDAWHQWSKPESDDVANEDSPAEEDDDDEEYTYQPIKLPIVGTIRVRFTIAEPLKPRHFSLDELDDDDE